MKARIASLLVASAFALLTPAVLAEQDRREEMTAKQFLEWSMDQHAKLKTYQASILWRFGDGTPKSRLVLIEGPDKYRVTTNNAGFALVSVSDGRTLLEYSNDDPEALEYRATSHIGTSPGMQMNHHMFCGSLLYKFFLGSKHLDKLAQLDKQEIEFGDRETLADGRTLQIVKFYGTYTYGHVIAHINVSTGFVERLTYDDEGLVELMKDIDWDNFRKTVQDAVDQAGIDTDVSKLRFDNPPWTTEYISVVATDEPISPDVFSTATPHGIKVRRLVDAWGS